MQVVVMGGASAASSGSPFMLYVFVCCYPVVVSAFRCSVACGTVRYMVCADHSMKITLIINDSAQYSSTVCFLFPPLLRLCYIIRDSRRRISVTLASLVTSLSYASVQ
jgi:hypothetical protein